MALCTARFLHISRQLARPCSTSTCRDNAPLTTNITIIMGRGGGHLLIVEIQETKNSHNREIRNPARQYCSNTPGGRYCCKSYTIDCVGAWAREWLPSASCSVCPHVKRTIGYIFVSLIRLQCGNESLLVRSQQICLL